MNLTANPMVGSGSAFLRAGGELAALIDGRDWSAKPIGPRHGWPRSLQTALRILVTSRYAMWLGRGPELTFFTTTPTR